MMLAGPAHRGDRLTVWEYNILITGFVNAEPVPLEAAIAPIKSKYAQMKNKYKNAAKYTNR